MQTRLVSAEKQQFLNQKSHVIFDLLLLELQ